MTDRLFPEGVQTSCATAVKLNAWALVALLASAFAHWFVRRPDLGGSLRAAVALAPLVPSLLYVRAIARWIRSLDELQRHIQLEAWFFATTGTIFVATALSLLGGTGVLRGTRFAGGLGWEGTYALTFFLWVLGCAISNRRYR